MTRRDHLHAVSSWLNDLNELTAGARPLADNKPKIATLASALSEEFPPGAFTRSSLLVVSRAYKFFPSYSEICETLSPWWKDHRPMPTAIAQTDRSVAEKQAQRDRENAESWAKTPQEIRAKITEIRNGFMPDMLGSVLRRRYPHPSPAPARSTAPGMAQGSLGTTRTCRDSAPQPPTSTTRSSEATGMTPRPLQCFELANLVAEVSHDLRGCHPNDALGVAQWIAINAIRCWPPRTASRCAWTHFATVRD